MERPKVVIIGGGFGGLNVARSLRHAKVDILLIDKKNHHLFQPLLYQVATAALSPADIATPLREILRNQKNASVIMGEVCEFSKETKEVVLKNGDRVSYDKLIIATGARHSYFGNDSWEDVAPGLKTILDALHIREKILISFEKAERIADIEKAQPFLNFVIIGAGPTGVEMAGAIAEIAYKTMFKNFTHIDPGKAQIFLIEGAPRVLPPFPEKLSAYSQKTLEKIGVKVITSKIVTEITEDGVAFGDEKIEAKNIIWAAGNQASPILKSLDVPLDKQGRVIVDKYLNIPNHQEIFVIGDSAQVLGKKDVPLPGVASVAIQQGKYLGKMLRKKIQKKPPFSYFDKGSLATIGLLKAVGFCGKLKFSGLIAWLMWVFIHIMYLVDFRNRFTVLTHWYFNFLSGLRGARIIQHSIDEHKHKK